jgi:hypothetical protein
MRTGALLVSIAALTACRKVPATQIMVVVHTDLQIGQIINGIRISGAASLDSPFSGAPLFDVCAALGNAPPRVLPPLVLGVEFADDSVQRVTITAKGYSDNACRTSSFVKQSATVAPSPNDVQRLELSLHAACVPVVCDEGSTCVDGGCVSDERPNLPKWDPGAYPDGFTDPLDGGLSLDGGSA